MVRKFMTFLDHWVSMFEFAFVAFVALLMVMMLLTACDLCGCKEEGTLKLREPGGEYTRVCHGTYDANSKTFTCDQGLVIHNPVNFLILKRDGE